MAQFWGGNSDFLEQLFAPSKSQQQVINIGNDKRSVGNEILQSSTTIQIDSSGSTRTEREPLLVRFTKFLLRLTIVLSISMVIYSGLRYIIALGKDDGVTNLRDNLLYIVGGILIAMLSYAIILLLQSIGFSTLIF